MADYQATVEVQLNGLEKLEQAEQKIKAMDGKKVKVGMDVDSSSLKKAQESLQKSLSGGVGGGTGIAKGVKGYFSEYNKAIKEGYRAAEKAVSAGEKTHLREKLEKQSADYFNEAKLIRQKAQKNLKTDDFRDFAIAARKANISARAESNKKQEAIAAKQVQQHFDNLDKAERAAAQRSAKEQAKIAQQTHTERQKGIEKAFNDAAKAEAAESKRIAQEQAKIDRVNHAERQKELNSAFKDYDNAQIKAAKESQNRLNSYLNAARNMGDSNQADALREKAKTQVDDINAILKDNKISDAARSSIESMRDTNASNNDAKDFIQRQKNAYKDATNQSNLYAKSLSDVYKGYQKLQTAAVKARDGSAEQEYLANQAQNLRNQYDAQKGTEDYNNLSNIQKQNLAYMERAGKLQIGTAAAQKEASIQAQVSNQQFKDIYSAQKQINALEFEQSKITDKNSNAYKAYSDAIKNTAAIQSETMAKHGKLDGFEQARMDSLKQQAELQKEFFDANNVLKDSRDAEIAQNRFQANIKANSRMLKPYKQQIDDINEAYANATTKTELEDANKQAQLLFSRAAVEGKTGMTFIDQIKDGFSNFGANVVGQFMSAYAITRAVTGTVKAMYSNVAQMDSAMTELYKVTDNSDKEYADYSKGIKRTSMEIGATQTSLVQATATFARLGYNLQDSAELGKNAALFANVGDEGMTSEEAATDMVAVMKGFNIQAEDSLHIVDAFNKVGNEFAISSTGIGESLKRSGGALATANNSLEESIGLTVAANDAMQDPAATGTALKTIALRIRGRHTCPSCSNTCPLTQYKLVA